MTLSRDDTLAYLEGFELFLAGTLARQAWGDHICFAKFDQTPNGSPEELVDDGVAEAAAVTGGWANQLARALEPAQTEQAILSVLDRFEQNGFRVEDFANVAAKKFLLGTLLGALDSQWEREHEEVLQPVKFAIGPVPLNITGSTFDQALKHWDKQQVLTRPAFDALAEGTKRRAFTVAGIAKNDMIDTVHAELRRQIAVGSATEGAGVSLREFHKFAKTRLESAGWTPSSPSHVETIFRTNIISAVSSGRYAEMRQPAVMAALPLWQILAVRDPRTRDTHKAANGVVLLATDPFWKHAYPPFGYNCRCKVCARTQAWLARASKSLGPTPRDLPDPGFDSGTKTLVQVPDAALKQTPAATPQAPVAPAQAPPGLGAPSPFPAMPPGFQLPTSAPEVPVAPSSAGLGAPSPFVPYTAPTEPVPLVGPEPITSGPTEHVIPPAPAASLLPPSPFPNKPLAPSGAPIAPLPTWPSREKLAEAGIEVLESIKKLAKASTEILGRELTTDFVHSVLGLKEAGVTGKIAYRIETNGPDALEFSAKFNGSHISREYKRVNGELVVHHQYFKLSEQMRASGIGKKILRAQALQYDALGVARIETEAAWDGQYVWPRMGFTLREPAKLDFYKSEFAKHLVETYGLTEARAAQFADAGSIHELATTKIDFPGAENAGKEFLIARGNGPRGQLINLHVRKGEPEEVIFRNYLGLPPRAR